MKIFDSSIVDYFDGVSNSKEFIEGNPTIEIEEAMAILEHHKYHSYRNVFLDDWTTGHHARALIYESTKDNIEIICRCLPRRLCHNHGRLSHRVSTKELFDWMGY